MPQISVVVPIHNVEPYLAECLQSLASQTFGDLEVVMVDDGSTDGSARIAERFADRDRRFRLIAQANGGLSAARNAGTAAARGELLAFADSDDVLPHDAYERLRGALSPGSDFATGNVRRLSAGALRQAHFLSAAFAQSRPATHVTRCPSLLADRTAWNKLFRRGFWDAHGFRFPEGRVHEDIPVMLPAHFKARAVDVVAAPVYYWRRRAEGDASITQRRLELQVMRDRLTAIEEVRAFLAASGMHRALDWYDERLVRDDLRLHLELLHLAAPEYREEFMARSRAILDGAPAAIFRRLPAVNRLEWHLLRSGLVDEAAEVARFAAEEAPHTPPLRRRGRYYGDYPFRTDPALRLPRSLYRLGRADAELALSANLERLEATDEGIAIAGHAHIAGFAAADQGAQRVVIGAVRKGRWHRLRRHLRPVRATTREVYRPDLIAAGQRRLAWAGFEAAFRTADLRDGSYEVFAYVRSGLVVRRRARFALTAAELLPAVHAAGRGDALVKGCVSAEGTMTLQARTQWLRVEQAGCEDGRVTVAGPSTVTGATGVLELQRRSDGHVLRVPLEVSGERFRATFALAGIRDATPPLEAQASPAAAAQQAWALWAVIGGRRLPVWLHATARGVMWESGERQLLLVPTPAGDATLIERTLAPAPQAASSSS